MPSWAAWSTGNMNTLGCLSVFFYIIQVIKLLGDWLLPKPSSALEIIILLFFSPTFVIIFHLHSFPLWNKTPTPLYWCIYALARHYFHVAFLVLYLQRWIPLVCSAIWWQQWELNTLMECAGIKGFTSCWMVLAGIHAAAADVWSNGSLCSVLLDALNPSLLVLWPSWGWPVDKMQLVGSFLYLMDAEVNSASLAWFNL